MSAYLLDTHIWVWAVTNAVTQASPEFFAELEGWQREGAAQISPFSAWEIALLTTKNQLSLPMSVDDLWRIDTGPGRFVAAPLTTQILIESTRLPGNIHADPADRILIATARIYDMTLVTRDKLLLSYSKQGHVRARKP